MCGSIGVFVLVPGVTETFDLGPRAAGAIMFVTGMGARPALEWLLAFLQRCRDDPAYPFRALGMKVGRGKD